MRHNNILVIVNVGHHAVKHSELCGRTEQNALDVFFALDQAGVDVNELLSLHKTLVDANEGEKKLNLSPFEFGMAEQSMITSF